MLKKKYDEPTVEAKAYFYEKIETKFGEIKINLNNKIFFSSGLIGLPMCKNFCLASNPISSFSRFNILQSLDNKSLSFLVLPLFLDNDIIEKIDLENSARNLGFALEDLAIILVASTKIIQGQKKITVNTRAPIFIDIVKKTAVQYVMQNTQYSISQVYC